MECWDSGTLEGVSHRCLGNKARYGKCKWNVDKTLSRTSCLNVCRWFCPILGTSAADWDVTVDWCTACSKGLSAKIKNKKNIRNFTHLFSERVQMISCDTWHECSLTHFWTCCLTLTWLARVQAMVEMCHRHILPDVQRATRVYLQEMKIKNKVNSHFTRTSNLN